MKKRMNSTDRRKLESEQIDIRINSDESTKPVSFNANLDLRPCQIWTKMPKSTLNRMFALRL